MKLDEKHPGFSEMQNIKRRFFALRNGVIADVLKRAGSPYRIIFGLSLVDLRQIAAVSGRNADVAEALRLNDSTRESRLMWPMLLDPEDVSREQAAEWLGGIMSTEEADILCNALLRKTPFAMDIAVEQINDSQSSDLQRYAALRMAAALMYAQPEKAREMAQGEAQRDCAMTRGLTQMILQETEI